MAGSLIKIDEEIVTSPVATVELGGSNWDSSYDVYQVVVSNYQPVTDNTNLRIRVTVSGTADSSANYDFAGKFLAKPNFFNFNSENQTQFQGSSQGTSTGEVTNQILYLFNFNNASEYSFMTLEESARDASGNQLGFQGGIVNTVAQACDGLQFSQSSGNIASAKFSLYGLKK